ncbi:hypothetical protein [Pseudomonas sp. DP-17]|uniref:hypothetical protein n=1 Tax=Pseudomonas sp. DP-17 TaxID=1580486 RepID=UPI001EFB2967|nr:hypothetical protein [Pseudomonas sp. DP-17]MCG8911002.1 hypothetical protein [Pseudomonas sp. DP-17]
MRMDWRPNLWKSSHGQSGYYRDVHMKSNETDQPGMTNGLKALGHVAIGIQYEMGLAFAKANPNMSTEDILKLAAIGAVIQYDAVIDQHYTGKSAPEITSKLRNTRPGKAR